MSLGKDYLFKALSQLVEFNDFRSTGIALDSFARLYQATEDDTLLMAVPEVLGVSVEEEVDRFSTTD